MKQDPLSRAVILAQHGHGDASLDIIIDLESEIISGPGFSSLDLQRELIADCGRLAASEGLYDAQQRARDYEQLGVNPSPELDEIKGYKRMLSTYTQ